MASGIEAPMVLPRSAMALPVEMKARPVLPKARPTLIGPVELVPYRAGRAGRPYSDAEVEYIEVGEGGSG
jgi:hypothetical protein